MGSIQNFIIGCVIAFVCGVTSSGIAVWKYQSAKYKEKALVAERVQKDALIAAQDKILKQERQNETLTSSLDKLATEYASKRDADATTIRKLLADKSKWLRSPVKCEASSAGTSDSASDISESEATIGELSGEFQEWLVEKLKAADKLRDYANVCYAYVQEVEKQRERMQNEQQQ